MKTIRIKFKEKSIQTIVDADIMKKARMSTIPLNVIKIKKEVEIKPQKQEREKEKPQIKQEPINQIQTQKETTKPAKKVIVRERTQQPTKKKILTVQTPEKKSQKPIQKQTVQHQIGKTDIKAGKLDGQMIAKKTSENLEPLTMKQIVELSKLSGELQTSQNIYGEAPIFGEQDSFQLNQNRNIQQQSQWPNDKR
ncbi:MAG: hypothetical protein EZS28_053437 [Streblomastix strix]|uniref:Uncharacterized protein n=1 Tax=Streblomastix strix TaxID=222440 RepID=A0A5J4RAJ0_9EUKA|nr:MAG: hypothetical protein EZS28_053437 [Streblomastix strix]